MARKATVSVTPSSTTPVGAWGCGAGAVQGNAIGPERGRRLVHGRNSLAGRRRLPPVRVGDRGGAPNRKGNRQLRPRSRPSVLKPVVATIERGSCCASSGGSRGKIGERCGTCCGRSSAASSGQLGHRDELAQRVVAELARPERRELAGHAASLRWRFDVSTREGSKGKSVPSHIRSAEWLLVVEHPIADHGLPQRFTLGRRTPLNRTASPPLPDAIESPGPSQ